MPERASHRLARIEQVRGLALEEARRALEDAVRLAEARRQAAEALDADVTRTEERLRTLAVTGATLDLAALDSARDYVRWRRKEQASAREACSSAERRVDDARDAVAHCVRERDVIRRLRDRRVAEERAESLRAGQHVLDEGGSLRHVARSTTAKEGEPHGG